MEKYRYIAYKAEITPLPHLRPTYDTDFQDSMESHAPFIATRHVERTDLGDCIIQTVAPHYVCKFRAFATADRNPKTATRAEEERIEYLERRLQLVGGGDDEQPTYDRELDEPRIVAKVPGLNVYLELFGCLDGCDIVDWREAMSVMTQMALWVQNIWIRRDRLRFASHKEDWQPVTEWHEDYDPGLRPTLLRKCGIGVWPDIDTSRRPDLLFSKAPKSPDTDIEGIRLLKAEKARLDAEGIHPASQDF